MEDLGYEAESVRRFTGLRLAEPIPDASAILHFHHLLEKHDLGQGLFTEIQGHLKEQRVRLQEGTIVDATIIAAPSSTKNRARQWGPEMRQVKKLSACRNGKMHIPPWFRFRDTLNKSLNTSAFTLRSCESRNLCT